MKLIAYCLLLLTATACLDLSKDPPEKRQFLLRLPKQTGLSGPKEPLVIRFNSVQVASPFERRSFVYRIDEDEYETDFYSEFLVLPSQCLTDVFREAIATIPNVTPLRQAGANAQHNLTLRLTGVQIYGDYRDASKPQAILILRATFVRRDTDSKPRRLRFAVPATDSSPEALVHAFNQALVQAMHKIAEMLAE